MNDCHLNVSPVTILILIDSDCTTARGKMSICNSSLQYESDGKRVDVKF